MPPTHREQMLMRRLHQLSGIGIFLFLAMHIAHIGLMATGPHLFNTVTEFLKHPVARVLHIFLFFSVLLHAINGTRRILLDFAPGLYRFERHSMYAAAFLFALVFIPSTLLILMDAFLPMP